MESFIAVVIIIVAVYVVYKIFTALIKWILIGLVIVLAIAFFSNPDELNHKKKFKEIVKSIPVKIKDDALQIDNYKVFSLAKVKIKGEEKTVGVGMFGKIWYFDEIKESVVNP